MSVNTEQLKQLYKVTLKIEEVFKEVNALLQSFLGVSPKDTNDLITLIPNGKFKLPAIKQIQSPFQTTNESSSKKPKPPLTPFFLFLKDKRDVVKTQYPTLTSVELSNVMGQVWKELSPEEKLPYEELYKQSKAQYTRIIEQMK